MMYFTVAGGEIILTVERALIRLIIQVLHLVWDVRLYNGRGIGGDAQGDTYFGIEGLVGSSHGDNLHGSFANNTLDGGGGNDYLYGYSGNDTFIGGSGRDYMDGGTGFDTVDYSNSTIHVYVNFQSGVGSAGALGDTYQNVESAIGTLRFDTFRGKDGVDNEFFGRSGNDVFYSSSGNNLYNGGGNIDRVDYGTSNAAVYIDLENGEASGGHANGDRFVNINNIKGSRFNDEISGDNMNNKLLGGRGEDVLYGKQGNDKLFGGEGADEFIFKQDDGRDTITDFSGENGDGDGDQINLEDYGIASWNELNSEGDVGMYETNISLTSSVYTRATVIYNDNGDRITLLGVEIDELDSNDFIF